jgi:hypothetical protein
LPPSLNVTQHLGKFLRASKQGLTSNVTLRG